MKKIILTEKEIIDVYNFCKNIKKPKTESTKHYNNVVIRQEPCGGIGELLYIQTQEDLWDKSDNWKDITDYDAW